MGRAPCCDKNGLKKGPWTPEEDQKLIDYIQKNGYGNWRTLPKNAGLQRCGKSCRLRWTNYLRPDIKRGRFSFEEEETIIQLHSILGNKWSAIAARLPGRTDNEIKNYWNTYIRKKLLRMGIDPVTHSPRLDLLDLSSILNSSLYNPSQMHNISRMSGVRPLVNPELLRLAALLFSSENGQENQLSYPQVQNQLPPLSQPYQTEEIPKYTTYSTPCLPLHSDAQVMEPNLYPLSSKLTTSFNPQNCQVMDYSINETENYVPFQNYSYNGSEQSLFDSLPSENSTFQSNSNFSFQSVLSTLSTPSSSPTPLNSHSTYINSCSTITEDKRASHCSNTIKFEMPAEILNVNEFM